MGTASHIYARLRRNWWTACAVIFFISFVIFLFLYNAWHPAYAWRWMIQAMIVAAYLMQRLWSGLEMNYDPTRGILWPQFGYGTWLTVLRGTLISILAGFLFQPYPVSAAKGAWLVWLPGMTYLSAAVLDYFDGYLARKTRHETRLGARLDTELDALGMLIAPLLAVCYDQLPVYYLSVGAAYYLFQFGLWMRKKMGKPVVDIRPRAGARLIAGFQMGFVGSALLPVLSPPVTTIAASIFMIPLLAGFCRDWWVVCNSGKINTSEQFSWEYRLNSFVTGYLPLFLRIIILMVGANLIRRTYLEPLTGADLATDGILNLAAMRIHIWYAMILFAAAIMLALGILGRIAALGFCLICAWTIHHQGLHFELVIGVLCGVTIMMTGSGRLSLWRPEDKILLVKQG